MLVLLDQVKLILSNVKVQHDQVSALSAEAREVANHVSALSNKLSFPLIATSHSLFKHISPTFP